MIISKLKNWWQLSRPSALKFVFGIVFSALSKLCFYLISFVLSSIISGVQIAYFSGATTLVYFVASLSVGFALFHTASLFICLSEEKRISRNLEKTLCCTCFKLENQNTTLSLGALKNSSEASEFFKILIEFFGSLVALIFVLVVLGISSVLILIMTLTLGTICLSLYFVFSNHIAKIKSHLAKQETETNMAFLDLIDGSSFAYDYSKETYLYEKFAEKSNVFNKTNAKYERAKLLYNSWVLCVWYVGISLIIIYMIKLLKYDYLELNLFIICVPYLALLITLFSNISGFFISLNHASDSTIALLDFLALAPPQIIGSNQTTLVKGTLKLDNATILAGNKPLLNNVSLCVKKGQIAVLEFKEKSAFLALCSVLRRKSALDKGTISIDDINIKDFEKQTYTNNLTIISQPYYLAGSTILEFFKTTNASQNKIESFLKQTGIKALLKKEKLSLNSPLNGVLNKDLLFVLNTVRAYLDGAEIMAFFGLHFFANAPYKKFFDRLLSKIKKDRTIIVLSTSFANILPSFYYKIDRLGNLKSTN